MPVDLPPPKPTSGEVRSFEAYKMDPSNLSRSLARALEIKSYQRRLIGPISLLELDGSSKPELLSLIDLFYQKGLLDSFDPDSKRWLRPRIRPKTPFEILMALENIPVNSEHTRNILMGIEPALLTSMKILGYFDSYQDDINAVINHYCLVSSSSLDKNLRLVEAAVKQLRTLRVENIWVVGKERLLKKEKQSWEEVEKDPGSEYNRFLSLIQDKLSRQRANHWLSILEKTSMRTEEHMMRILWEIYADSQAKKTYKNNEHLFYIYENGFETNLNAMFMDIAGQFANEYPALLLHSCLPEGSFVEKMLVRHAIEIISPNTLSLYYLHQALDSDSIKGPQALQELIKILAQDLEQEVQLRERLN